MVPFWHCYLQLAQNVTEIDLSTVATQMKTTAATQVCQLTNYCFFLTGLSASSHIVL